MRTALCLHGYVANAGGLTAAQLAAKYMRSKILLHNDVDIFVHSWDINNKNFIENTYKDNLRKVVFEPQKTFDNELKSFDQEWFDKDFNRSKSVYKNNTFFRGLSFLYSRKQAIYLKNSYEEKNNFEYDCTIIARMDLGTRGKEYHQKYYATNINFIPTSDMSKLHCAYWDQFNHGFPDHWFYSNSKNMTTVANLYDDCFEYYQKTSDYVDSVLNGWIDSNQDDIFSNEMLKENKTGKLKKWNRWDCIDNHKIYKWHFYKYKLNTKLELVDIT